VSTSQLIQIRRPRIDPKELAPFRWGRVADRVILTHDSGAWHTLSEGDMELLLAGTFPPNHPDRPALAAKGFLRDGLDLDTVASAISRRKRFVGVGPHLHIVLTTLRCNQSCRYCHASRADMDQVQTDMTLQTAKRVVDLALQTTSPYVNFEFQGGEPTVNFDAIRFIVEYSREKNRYENKQIDWSLVTNFTAMDEEKARWLLDNDVLVCTSLDGPEELHNWNRTWQKGSNAWATVVQWIRWFNQRYIEMGRDPNLWHVDALMTTTRRTLNEGPAIIDLYAELGIRNLHLRPLNPYGFALSTWKTIGYTIDEYLAFYRDTLDRIIDRNLQGQEMIEGTAATFLAKMLTPDDPNFVDIRSPCGAGSGQVAYNWDGRIFTCDEARMAAAAGNDSFQIGDVANSRYLDVQHHPTVKAMALASLQDSLPSCHTCWNLPFCGVCPMHDVQTLGDLWGQRPRSSKCKEHYTISSHLLSRLLGDPSGEVERVFRRWTVVRPRELGSACAT
jgi:His-Xaa-Ser system radical SAM maturase HxsB